MGDNDLVPDSGAKPPAEADDTGPDRVYQLMSLGLQQGTDPKALTELYALYKDAVAAEATRAWNAAMARFQAECPPVLRATQGHHGRYADFSTIMRTIRPHLERAGLSVTFSERTDCGDDRICLQVHVRHVGGHTETTQVAPLPMDRSGKKSELQGMGSSMSYAKRYGLILALNLQDTGEVDDDGHRGGAQTITYEQAADLQALAEEVGADTAKFLAYIGAESFAAIKARDHHRAVAALEAKRGRQPA